MTIRETIDALPTYQRAVVENLITAKMKDNWTIRNAGVVEEIIADVKAMDWSYFEPAQPESDEESPEVPEGPIEDLEQPAAGEGE